MALSGRKLLRFSGSDNPLATRQRTSAAMKLRSAILATVLTGAMFAQTPPQSLHWNSWSNAAFARARAEHKFVLLDLEAVWCHWCHVMDDVTYRDPDVIRLLDQRYVVVKVDQDARPDVANRYQDWGWPATIVFAADGSEIVKRQGYIPPHPMTSMLQAIIDDPSPGPSVEKEAAFQVASTSLLPPALFARVQSEYEQQYDAAQSGWGFGHKYLDRDSVEYALRLAASGNRQYAHRAASRMPSGPYERRAVASLRPLPHRRPCAV